MSKMDVMKRELCKIICKEESFIVSEVINKVGDLMYIINRESDNLEVYSCYKDDLGGMLANLIDVQDDFKF